MKVLAGSSKDTRIPREKRDELIQERGALKQEFERKLSSLSFARDDA